MQTLTRFYSPYINRFLQPDTLIPRVANPQSWNRFSYVLNSPTKYNDPTGHCFKDPESPPIYYSREDGVGIKYLGCTGGESYKRFWRSVVLPKLKASIEKVVDAVDFGMDTKDYWTGTKTTLKIGFGMDAAVQLLKDVDRKDLSWDQRLTRAGISGVEGLSISAISAKVATKTSQAVLAPSIRLAVTIKHPVALALPPVAVAATWATTYLVTNMALSYVADQINENLPYINP